MCLITAISSSRFGYANDDELDGFFDAGMLAHALKELQGDKERGRDKTAKRRLVGKSLKLNEY